MSEDGSSAAFALAPEMTRRSGCRSSVYETDAYLWTSGASSKIHRGKGKSAGDRQRLGTKTAGKGSAG